MADTDAERSIKRPGCTSMMCFGFFSTLTIALAGLLGCYSAQAAADTSCLPSYTLELVGDIEDMTSTQELVTHEHIPFLHEPPTDLQQRIENWRSGPPIVPVAIDNHLIPSDFKSPVSRGFELVASTINPPDNTMAINTDGILVCAINSRLIICDTAGKRLFDRGLSSFFTSSLNGPVLSRFFCDPRVVYDTYAARFIVSAMTCEGSSTTSQLLLAVSKSQNPLDGWWFYQIAGNQSPPLAVRTWFDFPNISVNRNDVFITTNLFTDNGDYRQAAVFQLRKQPLLSGSLPSQTDLRTHLSLEGQPYALFPVPNASGDGSTSTVLISNGLGSEDKSTIALYEFTGSTDNGLVIRRTQVNVPTFRQPAFARQPQSSVILSCFDQRGAGGLFIDGKIHYVFTVDNRNGNSAIMYLVLEQRNASWRVAASRLISQPDRSLAYPSIASMSPSNREPNIVLTYTYASSQLPPGIAARIINSKLELSDERIVRVGDGSVQFQSIDNFSRWADYTATVTDISGPTPAAWIFAPYGSRTGVWNNYVARISLDSPTTSVTKEANRLGTIELYPQPISQEAVSIRYNTDQEEQVTLQVYSLTGEALSEKHAGFAVPGINTYHYNVGDLPPGAYGLLLRTDKGKCHNVTFQR